MWQALKAHDLQRDPRFALHSGSYEPDDWHGDAKLAGLAEELRDDRINGEGEPVARIPARRPRGLDRSGSTRSATGW